MKHHPNHPCPSLRRRGVQRTAVVWTFFQSFITDQSGKFFFFARFGAKNISDLPEAKLNLEP